MTIEELREGEMSVEKAGISLKLNPNTPEDFALVDYAFRAVKKRLKIEELNNTLLNKAEIQEDRKKKREIRTTKDRKLKEEGELSKTRKYLRQKSENLQEEILSLLKSGTDKVKDISANLEVPQPTITYQLKKMMDLDLVYGVGNTANRVYRAKTGSAGILAKVIEEKKEDESEMEEEGSEEEEEDEDGQE